MRKLLGALVCAVTLIFTLSSVYAGEVGTRDEAVAMVKRVQQWFKEKGKDATFEAVTKQNTAFKDRDLYLLFMT